MGQLELVNAAPTPNDTRSFGSALRIGNGRLGAKVFGWPTADTIPLNDTTLWFGPGPEHFESYARHDAFLATRAALETSDYVKATNSSAAWKAPTRSSTSRSPTCISPSPSHETYTNYTDTLDLDTAVITTCYTVNGTTFTREKFISYPAQAIVLRLTADKPSALTFTTGSTPNSTMAGPR